MKLEVSVVSDTISLFLISYSFISFVINEVSLSTYLSLFFYLLQYKKSDSSSIQYLHEGKGPFKSSLFHRVFS